MKRLQPAPLLNYVVRLNETRVKISVRRSFLFGAIFLTLALCCLTTWFGLAAYRSLRIRDPNIVTPALRAALKDPDKNVRYNAASALWKLGTKARAALPELIEAHEDPDQDVREQVDNVLWDLAPEEVARPLLVEEHTPMVAGSVTTQTLSRLEGGELYPLIRPGTRLRCATYQSVADHPLYLYRGSTLKKSEDHFLGLFEAVPWTTPPTNIDIQVVYIVDNDRILLCARDYGRKQFVELRRVEDEAPK